MCEFISWIEKGKKVYYLTPHLAENTPRGKMVTLKYPGDGELVGHYAIRDYFELRGGKEKECTDFSTPDSFPPEIVATIKGGGFRGWPMPRGLLLKPLDNKYKADL